MLEPDAAQAIRQGEQEVVVVEVARAERRQRLGDEVAVGLQVFRLDRQQVRLVSRTAR